MSTASWDQAQLLRLARETGTPVYVYDIARLTRTVEEMWTILRPAGASLYFATMANDRDPILSQLAACGVGACVNSIPHFDMALRNGFSAENIQFTSTGIKSCDMQILRQRNVRTNIDSLAQLDRWFAAGASMAGVRLNAASLLGATAGDRIGLEARDLKVALEIAARHGGRISGVHVYVGTNFQTPEDMVPTLKAFLQLASSVPDLRYVNVGGGIGVDYTGAGCSFDLRRFGHYLADLMLELRRGSGAEIELIVEPGRSLVAPCAVFVAEITDVKTLHGTRYVTVDGSIAMFPRPFHHPESRHRVHLLHKPVASQDSDCESVIVGRTTFSKDILGTGPLPAAAEVGDLVMMENAGAYSQSMASCFLGQQAPMEIYVDDDRGSLSVAAE